METILRRKIRSSLKMTATFALGIILLYCSRSGSLYLDNFLTSALFLIVIRLCMVMYAIYWVSEMINIWDNGNAEIRSEKQKVEQQGVKNIL